MQVERNFAKGKYKETGDPAWDRIQYSVKVLSNAFYGLVTSAFYRFTNKKIGESVTAFGREHLKNLIQYMAHIAIPLIYGDTDSIFIQGPHDVGKCKELGEKLAVELSEGAMELEHEKTLDPWFTHGIKKRYYGKEVWPNPGKIYVKGYETVRGDAFEYQDKVLDGLLKGIIDPEIGPDNAIATASDMIRDILRGKVDPEDLVISKSVKDPSEYVNPQSMMGVRAAQKLEKLGYRWIPGTKVSFVVVDGSKSPKEVEPWIPSHNPKPTPDLSYYAGRVVRMIKDIAKIFDYDEDGLYEGTQQHDLFSFG